MDSFVCTFDTKRFVQRLKRAPAAKEPEPRDIYQEYTGLKDLNECFYKMYSDLLKHDAVNIREVDLGGFEYYELEDFFNFLETYDHDLFDFGNFVLSFKSLVITKPIFI